MSELRVVSIQIKDVLGAREFALEPGKITQLRGKNGSGKSTALQAVQAALAGGNLAKLARVDASGQAVEPEVVLVIEGEGTEAYRVERRGDKIRVRQRVGDTAAFEDVGKPQTWLRSLYDPQGANPVTFLTAPDKDRALLLLEALPLKFDRGALLAAMGLTPADELPPIPEGLHPLEECEWIRKAVFGKRTGVNRDEKSAAQAADQLRRNSPAVLPEDHAQAIADLEARTSALAQQLGTAEEAAAAAQREALAAAQATHDQDEQGITAAFKETAREKRSTFAAWEAHVRAVLEQQIAAEKAKVEQEVTTLREADELRLAQLDADLQAAHQKAAAARSTAESGLAALRTALTTNREQLAALREQARQGEKARALAEQAKEFDAQAERLKAESDRLTAAIESLDVFRRRMAEDLPIPGLTIEDRTIRVNGVPFDQLNTGQKVEIAVKVATLRAKGSRLPVVFVDGAEALDTEHFETLVARLAEEKVQAFVARVEDTDLRVVTDPPVEQTQVIGA